MSDLPLEAIFTETGPAGARAGAAAPSVDALTEALEAAGAPTTTVGGHVCPDQYPPRFSDDTSELAPEACWALQALVADHFITHRDPRWPAIRQYEKRLRSRLSELGLLLELNREHGHAFAVQADDPSPHSRVLLRTKTLSLAASALLLFLYEHYIRDPDAPVEVADMLDYMSAYRPQGDTDEAAFDRRIHTAIEHLKPIISPIPGTRRYLVSGVITSLVTAERVEALKARYKALIDGSTTTDGATDHAPGSAGADAHTACSASVPDPAAVSTRDDVDD
ncbi:DUF4194 domain-containing protein [Actinomadura viridis]|uniref:DUF4194 domain-containing protein n=1 Tax=Actinomadura viridis TaxID=58110 RepID=UPI00368FFE89